jgi:hypothetical protein
METLDQFYENIIAIDSLKGLDSEAVLNHIGLLIDISGDLGKSDGLQKAIKLAKMSKSRLASTEKAILYLSLIHI